MLELLQFRHSPFNEKVRWALDIKQVAHRRRSLLPGPHMGTVKALTGRTSTPVLMHDGEALDGSAHIIQWLEERYPNPRLLPDDAALRDEALGIQRRFDDDLTPRIRRPVLDAMLQQPAFFARVFADGTPAWKRFGYSCGVPLAAGMVRNGNGIVGAKTIEDGLRAGDAAFDFVAGRGAATGYLCGKVFSIADLTAASTLAVLVRPADSPMACPQPVGRDFRALMDRYADHPGADWVRGIYARHRSARRDFDGDSQQAA